MTAGDPNGCRNRIEMSTDTAAFAPLADLGHAERSLRWLAYRSA